MLVADGENRLKAFDQVVRGFVLGRRRGLSTKLGTSDGRDDGAGIRRQPTKIAGEVPGEQTVPRSEAWAATILLSRVHLNSVARIGIDAAYVVDGVAKRSRFEKGKNGDIWLPILHNFEIKDRRNRDC